MDARFENIREFLRACTSTYSVDPFRNAYVIFGLLWGLGLLAANLGHHVAHNEVRGVEAMVAAAFDTGFDHFVLAIPLLLGWVFGTLGTIRTEKSLARRRTIDLLEEEVAARTRGLRDAYVQTVLALSAAIEAKHPYTHGHCRRVWGYARAAALRLGVLEEELEPLRFAAYLHDIGKLRIPDHVLDKPGRLTDDEYDLVKKHPSYGAMILRPIVGFERVASLVRMHHEREDGTGYPDGLTGDQIPLLGKILAVADALDAMVSTRPYRPPLSMDAALAELRRCAALPFDEDLLPGKDATPRRWLDPQVVEAMEVAVREDLDGDPDSRPLSRPACLDHDPSRPVVQLRPDALWPVGSNRTASPCRVDRSEAGRAGADPHERPNCWEVVGCGQDPDDPERSGAIRCAVPLAHRFDDVNGGRAGGRVCWAVPGALCHPDDEAEILGSQSSCHECAFMARVRREEGLAGFQLVPARTRRSAGGRA